MVTLGDSNVNIQSDYHLLWVSISSILLIWVLMKLKMSFDMFLEVYNVNSFYGPDAVFPVGINIDMAKVMGVFLAQLR